ncbi:NAD(P)-binding domain-containing protein, partial [Streptomyces sp. NPDC001226]
MSKIGLIGLGRMGAPMCNNLVAAGYEVVAHDIDPGRAETRTSRLSDARCSGLVLPGQPDVRTLHRDLHAL